MKALLIIDMQKISFTDKTPRWEADEVVNRINQLAGMFRKAQQPVVLIQHDGTKEGICLPDTPEWEFLDSLDQKENDLVVSKTANDSFYKSKLSELLEQLNVKELVITGCATDFCVDATVKSALGRDFNITVIDDAHTTADRPGLSARQVIDHYNRTWQEMIPTNGRIASISTAKYMKNQ